MTTRVEDATAIRDHVVSLTRSDGVWKVVNGLPELVWQRAKWTARFSNPAELSGSAKSQVAAPNRLIIADRDKVLFRAEWSEGGPIRVMIFDRGAWEAKLLALPREI
jgi:hypothetical protein